MGLGSVSSPPSWLSREKRRGKSELRPVLPPSVSTGRSCLLQLAWLMNKPSLVQDWSWQFWGPECHNGPLVARSDLSGVLPWEWRGLGKTGVLWACGQGIHLTFLPSQTQQRLEVPLQPQFHTHPSLGCKYGHRGPETNGGQPRLTQPSPSRARLGTQTFSLPA